MEVEDDGVHHEEKPHLVRMRMVGEGVGLGLGVGEGQWSIEENEIEKCSIHVVESDDL